MDTMCFYGLCNDHTDISAGNQEKCFRAVYRVAKENGVTPYALDRVIWLACSGLFFKKTGANDTGEILTLGLEKVITWHFFHKGENVWESVLSKGRAVFLYRIDPMPCDTMRVPELQADEAAGGSGRSQITGKLSQENFECTINGT